MGQRQLLDGLAVAIGAWTPQSRDLLGDPKIQRVIVDLHRSFEGKRRSLLADRRRRQASYDQGNLPGYLEDHPATRSNWQVAKIPEDCFDRRVEITGPVNNTKMVINMLSPGPDGLRADMAMLDFEDSMKPSWNNIIDGVYNAIGAAKGNLTHINPGKDGKPGRIYQLDPANMAHPMFRIRGLHLTESNVTVDGKPVAAGLLDLVLCAAHTTRYLQDRCLTPIYYIPKVEHFLEARHWHELFKATEEALGIFPNILRTTLLIETLPAAFQMEEILYEIRQRALGLNGGRWDKIFSDIKVLRHHKDRISTDRSNINMTKSWMDNYAKRLVKICHKHGAFALGGMSAFTPGKDAAVRAEQTQKVVDDKAREAAIGHDGCWVSHPYFIKIARDQFPQTNQLHRKLDDFPQQPDLLPKGGGPYTMQGLRTNIRVGIAYLNGWNTNLGCIAFDNLMEDLATLEIARAQTWQWLNHSVTLSTGELVTKELVQQIFREECANIIAELPASTLTVAEAPLRKACQEAFDLFTAVELQNFLTETSELETAPESVEARFA